MKKSIVFIIFLILVAGGYFAYRSRTGKQEDTGYRTITVSQGPIRETVEATGSVSPLNRVEIKPPISGRMEKLLAEEGETVKDGQILAWMSSSDRAAILDAARGQGPDALKKWEDAYKPTPIIAPLSGVVILRNVVVGQTVDAATVLYAMSDTLIVLAEVDESDIGKIHIGMPAEVTLDAYPNQTVHGKVFDILYEGKNISNVITYGVKIKMDKVPSFFRSQMTANISFVVKEKEDAILVPASAIREKTGGTKQVFVPGPNGKPIPKEVETGMESNDKTEVVSGLQPGDQIILVQKKYVPQQGPQSSPLTMGGRPAASSGQAPRSRNQ